MKESWKIAALGGSAGAALALIVTFGAAALGVVPIPADGNAMHAYLLAHPEVIVEMTNKLQAQQDAQQENVRQAAVNKLGLKAYFDPRVAFVTGPANAKTELIKHIHTHHPQLMKIIVGIETVDHPSDGQLVAHARHYFKTEDLMLPQKEKPSTQSN